MSQEEVIEVLEKAEKPLSRKEIALLLGWRETKVTDTIRKLLQYGEIKCQEINRIQALKLYHCKRGMRIYFI